MACDGICCLFGAPGKLQLEGLGKRLDVLKIELVPAFLGPLPRGHTLVLVCCALLLRLKHRGLFDKETLSFVPLPRSAPLENDRPEVRVFL